MADRMLHAIQLRDPNGSMAWLAGPSRENPTRYCPRARREDPLTLCADFHAPPPKLFSLSLANR